MPKPKAPDFSFINSQVGVYGYKLVRKDEVSEPDTAGGNDGIEVPQKLLFPKIGERPEMKLNVVTKPRGTAGRQQFQVWRILGITKKEEEYCKKVLKMYLYLDPGVNMSEAKGNNDKGPIARAIRKAVYELPEFLPFEKYGYWPLDALCLSILKSTSQTAKGYGARARAKKKELAAAQTARETAISKSPEPAESTTLPTATSTTSTASAPPITSTSPTTSDTSAKPIASNMKRPKIKEVPSQDTSPKETGNRDADEGVGHDTCKGVRGGTDKSTNGEPGNDADGDACGYMSLVVPDTPEEDEEDYVGDFSLMNLDQDQDEEPEETAGQLAGPVLPTATSTPSVICSRTHPFSQVAPPRRPLSKALSTDRSVACAVLVASNRASVSPLPSIVSPESPSPPASTPFAGAPASAPTLQEPPISLVPTGTSPTILAELANLPVSILITLSGSLQAEVALFKASAMQSVQMTHLDPPSASTSTITQAKIPTPTLSNEAARSLAFEEPFDDNAYLSDEPTASEINPPVNPKLVLKTVKRKTQETAATDSPDPALTLRGKEAKRKVNVKAVVGTADKQANVSLPKRATRSTSALNNGTGRK
ncbi:unnamed protein product [Rhizoctonia solani]|uniref:Uncharacterized protein n=1 Tax=Rhizoctonia solani TaxID=456999 RepID=A0A8H2XLT3_9AGAM|nr:unnamed protein product [Rhizoctonia solani]